MAQEFVGDLILRNNEGKERLRLTGQGGQIIIRHSDGITPLGVMAGNFFLLRSDVGLDRISLVGGEDANVRVGGGDIGGHLRLFPSTGDQDDPTTATVHLSGDGPMRLLADSGDILLGGQGVGGDIYLFPVVANNLGDPREASVHLSGEEAMLRMGGNGPLNTVRGAILLFSSNRDRATDLNASIYLDGDAGDVRIGGDESGTGGEIFLYPSNRSRDTDNNASIRLNAQAAELRMGGDESGTEGDVLLYPNNRSRISTMNSSIHLSAQEAWLRMGGDESGAEAHVLLYPSGKSRTSDYNASIHLNAQQGNLRMGGSESGVDGDILLFPNSKSRSSDSNATIHLDGDAGDITLRNADCAEDFEVTDSGPIEPGMVVVIDGTSVVRPCDKPYDNRVAGVVSGAGNTRPGIVLGRTLAHGRRVPVALFGTSYCKADADFTSIDAGDMLTTSPTPGHAMKACDPSRAFGAVVGKALCPLKTGRGVIPVLVALQ